MTSTRPHSSTHSTVGCIDPTVRDSAQAADGAAVLTIAGCGAAAVAAAAVYVTGDGPTGLLGWVITSLMMLTAIALMTTIARRFGGLRLRATPITVAVSVNTAAVLGFFTAVLAAL